MTAKREFFTVEDFCNIPEYAGYQEMVDAANSKRDQAIEEARAYFDNILKIQDKYVAIILATTWLSKWGNEK